MFPNEDIGAKNRHPQTPLLANAEKQNQVFPTTGNSCATQK
jgi:hypothetical protein